MANETHEAKWNTRPCPICGEDFSITVLGHRTRELTSTIGNFIFELHDSICDNCGFVFNRRVPPDDFLKDYYQNSTMLLEPNYDMGARLELVKKVVPSGASIMEFGSKKGEFVTALRASGYDADGYDFTTDRSVSRTYDAALAYYILEHVVDPGAFIEFVKRSIKPDGLIIIEVPDFTDYTLHSLYVEHLNHFTAQHIVTLLSLHGIAVLDLFSGHSREYGITAIACKDLSRINTAKYNDTMDEFESYWQKKMAEGWGGKLRQN